MAIINICSEALLTNVLTNDDRVTITQANTEQQIATIKVSDFKKAIPYVGENLVLKSNTYYGIGEGFMRYSLSEYLKNGEWITITLEGKTSGTTAFSMGFITDEGKYQGDLWASSFDGTKKALTVIMPAYNGAVNTVMFYFSSPGITMPRIKLERGTIATPWCPASKDVALIFPFSVDEQLVPGEFWPNDEGNPSQVYIRSFIGTTQATKGQYIHIVDGIRRAEVIHASLYAMASRPDVKPKTIVNVNGVLSYDLWYDIYIRDYEVGIYKSLVLDAQGSNTLEKSFFVTVKYTKL